LLLVLEQIDDGLPRSRHGALLEVLVNNGLALAYSGAPSSETPELVAQTLGYTLESYWPLAEQLISMIRQARDEALPKEAPPFKEILCRLFEEAGLCDRATWDGRITPLPETKQVAA
jgi:hypothetical protein